MLFEIDLLHTRLPLTFHLSKAHYLQSATRLGIPVQYLMQVMTKGALTFKGWRTTLLSSFFLSFLFFGLYHMQLLLPSKLPSTCPFLREDFEHPPEDESKWNSTLSSIP